VLRPFADSRLRRLAPVVAACLLAFGCEPTPTAIPTALSTPAPTSVPATRPPSASPAARISLADALRDAVDVDAIVADLQQLQAITDQHGGVRPAGSDGHAAAAAFVADQLRAAGYSVTLDPLDVPAFRQTAPSTLEVTGTGARTFDDQRDFKAMLFSPSGEVTAPVFALGFNFEAQPGDTGGLGCSPADWGDVPAGVIVLVQPASCRRHDVVVQAQLAGAVGIITAYPSWTRDSVLRPTLAEPADIHIPAIGATHEVGRALADAAAANAMVHISTHTDVETRSSPNVIAETPWGDTAHVLMVGGHLDSVVDGPGINDNGSGTMAVLEIARELARLTGMAGAAGSPAPAVGWKVRVAFWTGEEIGLWGSRAYVQASRSRDSIEGYLNLDMLASPNGVRLVYDGRYATRPRESLAIGDLLVRALDNAGLLWQTTYLGGSSDHASFDQAGIPISGLFSGANERKTQAQVDLFGGSADTPADPCMHLPCDRVDKLDRTLLGELARAAGWTVGALASGQVSLTGG
jgi:aminopeptidase Y